MDDNVKITSDRKGLAIASLVLGIIGIVTLLIPVVKINNFQVQIEIFSLLFQIVGLIFGILGIKSSKRKSAIAGIILCVVGLLLVVVLNTAYFKESSTGVITTYSK
ncbi:MAG: hypothetical protein NTX66_02745 [Candidatus Falkowbacteria bacterium]|nr:hypothetical protein [Candidatus Falkowbacteria bacterium]